MGNCFGSEEAEVVEAVKPPGHHGHGKPQGSSSNCNPQPSCHDSATERPSRRQEVPGLVHEQLHYPKQQRQHHGDRGAGLRHDPGGAQPAHLHVRGAQGGDPELQAGHDAGRGRVRAGVQGVGGREDHEPGAQRRRHGHRRQEAQPGEPAGPARMAVGGELSGEDIAPEPGAAAGVLPGGPGAAARLRVHGQGQPREPPLQEKRVRPAHPVGLAVADRHRRCARPRLPPLLGEARHLPGFQSLQHPSRHALQREAVGLRAGPERADGRRQPHHDARDGYLRVRGAGVRGDGPPVREERRVRVRRGAAGDADGPAGARRQPPRAAAQPRGLGQALPGRPPEAGPPRRPQAGGPVPVQGRRARRAAHAELPGRRPQEPALHGRGPRRAPGGRADAAAPPPRVARRGRRQRQHVAEDRRKERARRAEAVAAAEGRVGRRAERPPVSSSEMT